MKRNPDRSRGEREGPSRDWHSGPIAWMARNAIAANLLLFLLLGGGLWTTLKIQKEVYPNYELDVVEVRVEHFGAAPTEVEQGIILPVEEAVRGIKEIQSEAEERSGELLIQLVSGTDRMKAFQDIDQAVNRIRTFPDDIEKPEVQLQSEQREVMSLVLFGEVDIWSLRTLAERLRDQLVNEETIHPGGPASRPGLHDARREPP